MAVAALAGLRALLPSAAGLALERGVTGAIGGRLAVGDVDLSLLRGGIALRDTTLSAESAAADAKPAVRIERLFARVAWRDLLERRVRLRALEADGLRLAVRRDADGAIDLVQLLRPHSGSSGPAQPPDPDSDAGGGDAWTFALDRAALERGAIRFRDVSVEGDGAWRLALDELRARRIGVEPGAYDEPARLSLVGGARDAELTFEATLDRSDATPHLVLSLGVDGLPAGPAGVYLPGVAWSELGGRLDAELHYDGDLQGAGELRADLALRDFSAGTPGRDDPELRFDALEMKLSGSQEGFLGPAELSGEVVLEDLSTDSGADVTRCLGALERLRAEVGRLRIGAPPPGGSGPAVVARVDELTLRAPDLELARGEHGFSCRPAVSDAVAGDETAEPGADVAFEIGVLEVEGGRLALSDHTVEPFVDSALQPLRAHVERLRWPPASAHRFELSARGLGVEPFEVEGSLSDGELRLKARLERVEITRFNPYLAHFSQIAAERGRVSSRLELRSTLGRDVEGRLRLVLHDAGFTALGERGVREDLGVSLPLAMALLRNPGGDVVLEAPFSRSRGVTELDLVSLVAHSTGRAFVNAVLTPLRVLGAVVPSGGAAERVAPEAVEFAPGGAELTDTAEERLAGVAQLLVRRPWLGLRLEPHVVAADVESIGERPGPARARAPSLDALGAERGERVADAFARVHGVSGRRIEIAPTERRDGGAPRVDLALAPLEALSPVGDGPLPASGS